MWIPILLTILALSSVNADIEEDAGIGEDADIVEDADIEEESGIEKDLNKCLEGIKSETVPHDLDDMCPGILDLIACLEDSFEKETGLTVEQLRDLMDDGRVAEVLDVAINVRSVIKELCDRDSELRKDFDKDEECLQKITVSDMMVCEDETKSVLDAFEEIENKVQEEANEDPRVYNRDCMKAAVTVACTASQIKGLCGDRASNTFREIIKRTTMFKHGICSEEQLEQSKNFVLENFIEDKDEEDLIHLFFDIKKRRK